MDGGRCLSGVQQAAAMLPLLLEGWGHATYKHLRWFFNCFRLDLCRQITCKSQENRALFYDPGTVVHGIMSNVWWMFSTNLSHRWKERLTLIVSPFENDALVALGGIFFIVHQSYQVNQLWIPTGTSPNSSLKLLNSLGSILGLFSSHSTYSLFLVDFNFSHDFRFLA